MAEGYEINPTKLPTIVITDLNNAPNYLCFIETSGSTLNGPMSGNSNRGIVLSIPFGDYRGQLFLPAFSTGGSSDYKLYFRVYYASWLDWKKIALAS